MCIVECTLEHGHEFYSIAVDEFTEMEIDLLLFPEGLYKGGDGIGCPI